MALQNCCGCCSLKTGALIIAILTLIHTSLAVLATIVHLTLPPQDIATTDNTVQQIQQRNYYSYLIGPSIIQCVIAFCFIYGVAKERKYFILPFLVVKVLEIVVLSIYIIFISFFVHPAFLLLFAAVGLAIYMWYVSFSFYKNLSERDAAPYSTIAMDKNILVGKV